MDDTMAEKGKPTEDTELYLNLNLVLNDMDENETGISPWEAYQHHIDEHSKPDTKEGSKLGRGLLTVVKSVSVVGLWYVFICSLDLVGSAFHLLGLRTAVTIFRNNDVIMNPICGVMISLLVTVILQSSTTSTFIVVTLVANKLLSVQQAIPLIMGANLGTTITGTIVSLTQSWERDEHRRAFAAAVLHGLFNLLTICVLLPLEVATGYLYHLTDFMVRNLKIEHLIQENHLQYVFTRSMTELIVQLDDKVIKEIAGNEAGAENKPILKYWCETKQVERNMSFINGKVNWTVVNEVMKGGFWNQTVGNEVIYHYQDTEGVKECDYLLHGHSKSETADGIFLLCGSLFTLCFSLLSMVKILQSLLNNKAAARLRKAVNGNCPGKLKHCTGVFLILIAACVTFMVQGSSVFTSTLIPLVGMGLLSMERAYPLILGANVGTGARGIMAAMSAYGDNMNSALQLAFCHLFFNISGLILFYPIPVIRRFPLTFARVFGNTTAKHPWFGVVYLSVMYFILPGAVLGLSVAGWPVLVGVGAPVCVFIVVILTSRVCATWWRKSNYQNGILLYNVKRKIKHFAYVVLPKSKNKEENNSQTQSLNLVEK